MTELHAHSFTRGADTGNISVIDWDTLVEYGGDPAANDDKSIIELEPGEYFVLIYSKDTWNGPVARVNDIKVGETGRLVVGDLCYNWSSETMEEHKRWHKFLDETGHMEKTTNSAVMWTGGDGLFEVTVIVEKSEE